MQLSAFPSADFEAARGIINTMFSKIKTQFYAPFPLPSYHVHTSSYIADTIKDFQNLGDAAAVIIARVMANHNCNL
eukprot:SAG31_NODE_83_length_27039_cov_14.035746_3_plen_76_part_00